MNAHREAAQFNEIVSGGPSPPGIRPGPTPARRIQLSSLSIVNNRTFKRLTYEVLDHDPDHTDITAFFGRFQAALTRPD